VTDRRITDEFTYPILDVDGKLIATKHRNEFDDGQKSFWFVRPNGATGLDGLDAKSLPLYGTEELRDTDRRQGTVVIVEGEKAKEAGDTFKLPLVFLATVNGANSTPNAMSLAPLKSCKFIILWPDADDVGRKHMQDIAKALYTMGVACAIVDTNNLPDKSDAADVDASIAKNLIANAVLYQPEQRVGTPKVFSVVAISDLFTAEIDRIAASRITGQRASLTWGDEFGGLNKLMDGLQAGLYCLHGQPGTGKSAFALQVAAQVDAPALYVSAEMSAKELIRRMAARITRTPRRKLMSGMLDPAEEMELLRRTMEVVGKIRIVDAASEPADVPFIVEQVREMREQDPDKHMLVIIDSLHSWVGGITADEQDVKEYEAIGDGIRALRSLSDKYNIPVLFLAERNRMSMKEGGLSAVAGSRAAEYRSDVVMSLDWVEYDKDDKTDHSNDPVREVTLMVHKNRFGPNGARIGYMFTGDTQSFSEY
jgi:archaellum biogenesis ATPase FlaH